MILDDEIDCGALGLRGYYEGLPQRQTADPQFLNNC
jgi:hypothetical protein